MTSVLARFHSKHAVAPAPCGHPGPVHHCWLWTAAKNHDGYGRFGEGGKNRFAHRVAYELLVGPIPEGLELDHLCRNRACVNPLCLEPVTHQENILRGESLSALAACRARDLARDLCPHGHLRDGVTKHGGRYCKTCVRERSRAYRQKAAVARW